jgi:hypothetical protein
LGRVGDRVVLARRQKSALQHGLERITEWPTVHLAISCGGLQEHRKPTIQVMDADGRIAGYAKLAVSPQARNALQREVHCLEQLAGHSELHGSVPQILGTFDTGEAAVSLQSAGPTQPASLAFGHAHWEFLCRLATVTASRKPFPSSGMAQALQGNLATLGPQLPAPWATRIFVALQRLQYCPLSTETPLVMTHGSFNPWNVRLDRTGRLFAFDWELAETEMTFMYDFFHFLLASSFYIDPFRSYLDDRVLESIIQNVFRATARWAPELNRATVSTLFLAYLTERALRRCRYALWRNEFHRDGLLNLLGGLLDRYPQWSMNAA